MANEFVARNGVIAQNNSTITGSLIVTGDITGSLFGTASFALSAPAFPYTGSARITGSLNIIGAGNLSAPISITTFFQTSSQVNTFNIPHDGAASRVYTGLTTTPILNYTGAGTGTGTVYGTYLFPTVVSSSLGTNSRITLGGLFVNASRNSAADLSSFSSNAINGAIITVGHTSTVYSGSITGTAAGVRSTILHQRGTITSTFGLVNTTTLATQAASATASITDAYGVQNIVTIGGGVGGQSNLTNYYAFYQSIPTVGTGGTLTNKYGLYFIDPNMPSYHAGSLGIGTIAASPNALQVSGSTKLNGDVSIIGNLDVTGSVGFSYEAAGVAWTTTGTLITGRVGLAGAGIQSAALVFGGAFGGQVSCTEAFDGTSWTAGGALNTPRRNIAGAGLQNAALAFGGNYSGAAASCTEAYDGISWSAGGAMIQAVDLLGGAGNSTSALAFGGLETTGFTAVTCTEAYNGSTWSTGGALSIARYQLAGAGASNTAALAFGGFTTPTFITVACTEAYNGSSWSTGGALITARNSLAGVGTDTAALAFGGSSPMGVESCTEIYNGSSWSAGVAMIQARFSLAGAGTNTAAVAAGGYDSSYATLNTAEKYASGPAVAIKTFDYSNTTGAVILSQVSASLNYADDATAAAAGVPLGGLYRNGNFIAIRIV